MSRRFKPQFKIQVKIAYPSNYFETKMGGLDLLQTNAQDPVDTQTFRLIHAIA